MQTNNTLVLGDCIEEMQKMADNSVEVVVTSPPYNIKIDYDTFNDWRFDYSVWTMNWLAEAIRVSKRGVMLNINTKASEQTRLYRLLGSIASRFDIQNSIVWAKSIHIDGVTREHSKPLNTKKYLNTTHEMVLHVVAKDSFVDIDRLAVGVPYSDKSNLARFGKSEDLRCGGSVWFVPYETKNKTGDHPATFPVDLAKRMILYAGGDGIVLDPFVGSGTTTLAAKILGRNSVGIDVSEKYLEMAKKVLTTI